MWIGESHKNLSLVDRNMKCMQELQHSKFHVNFVCQHNYECLKPSLSPKILAMSAGIQTIIIIIIIPEKMIRTKM